MVGPACGVAGGRWATEAVVVGGVHLATEVLAIEGNGKRRHSAVHTQADGGSAGAGDHLACSRSDAMSVLAWNSTWAAGELPEGILSSIPTNQPILLGTANAGRCVALCERIGWSGVGLDAEGSCCSQVCGGANKDSRGELHGYG